MKAPFKTSFSHRRKLTASRRQFADSLYRKLTPYSITSAPSIASLIASIVDPVVIHDCAGQRVWIRTQQA